MNSVVEIDQRIFVGSRYPAALNTPNDQIPLTLQDLNSLAAQIDAAIKDITGFGPEGETK
jgi:hypothetical protein